MIPFGLCAGASVLAALWSVPDRWVWIVAPWPAYFLSHHGNRIADLFPSSFGRWLLPFLHVLSWGLFVLVLTRVMLGILSASWAPLLLLSR